MILSYNSPVFERLFLELNQTVLDVDDFSPDVVRSFIRALYAGSVKLDTKQFRDMSKLGKVFSVSWVQERCKEFWRGLLEKVDSKSPYSTLQFLVEEAHYVKSALKDPSYLDRFITKICGLENKVELFIQPYLVDYTLFEYSQLNLALQVAKPGQSCILKIMKMRIEKQGFAFDDASRYLLQNMDLFLCIEQDDEGFEEVFDLLTDTKKNLNIEDLCMVNRLYRSAIKEQLKRVNESKSTIKGQQKRINESKSRTSSQDARSSISKKENVDSPRISVTDSKSMHTERGRGGRGRGTGGPERGKRSRVYGRQGRGWLKARGRGQQMGRLLDEDRVAMRDLEEGGYGIQEPEMGEGRWRRGEGRGRGGGRGRGTGDGDWDRSLARRFDRGCGLWAGDGTVVGEWQEGGYGIQWDGEGDGKGSERRGGGRGTGDCDWGHGRVWYRGRGG